MVGEIINKQQHAPPYKTNSETDSETGLLLYTVKENNRGEVFANINCKDLRGEKT